MDNRCCGSCCWFKHEDSCGWGVCYKRSRDTHCQELCTTGKYVSREEMRHHVAVLIQANRYRRDPHVPGIYKMPRPVELGRAIDFAVKYIKTFDDEQKQGLPATAEREEMEGTSRVEVEDATDVRDV